MTEQVQETGKPEPESQEQEEKEVSKQAKYTYHWQTANGYTYSFKNAKELVRKVLQLIEEARNNDAKLQHIVWTRVQELDPSIYEEWEKCINPETIRRNRADIQSEGEYLPTKPEVLFKRDFTVAEVDDCYSMQKPNVSHKYIDYLGKRVEQGDLSEERLENNYLGDL